MGDVVDIDSEDDLPEMRQWMADVQEVCPNVPTETVAQVLLETQDPINAIHKLLDRGRAENQHWGLKTKRLEYNEHPMYTSTKRILQLTILFPECKDVKIYIT